MVMLMAEVSGHALGIQLVDSNLPVMTSHLLRLDFAAVAHEPCVTVILMIVRHMFLAMCLASTQWTRNY
jgi:hypothetical protein